MLEHIHGQNHVKRGFRERSIFQVHEMRWDASSIKPPLREIEQRVGDIGKRRVDAIMAE